MPQLEYRKQRPSSVDVDAVAILAAKDDDGLRLGDDARGLGKALKTDLAADLAALHFRGEVGKAVQLAAHGRVKAKTVVVAGLGEAPDAAALRKAAGAAVRAAGKHRSLAVVVPGDALDDASEATAAIVEGVILAGYRFDAHKSDPDDAALTEVALLAGDGVGARDVKGAIDDARTVARAVCLARDLVNEPPDDKRPPALAERVAARAKQAGVKVKVRDESWLRAQGFGGMVGVGQGSSEPPRLVELRHAPARAKGRVVLAGKGITFDTGGVSLKPSNAMNTMKSDMAGAATVAATVVAAAELGLRVEVIGLLALAENMPSGDAIRVSDVLRHRDGTTVEVMNTDAEGRLVLADALAYGAEREPDALIDVATLTGAQVVALGSKVAAVMGADEVVADLERAAERTGERLWRLPLPAEYREHLDSEVADLKNIGKGREAGSVIAGMFLQEFTGGRPWAHLDIAGPAFDESGDAPLQPKGATGWGVRTLVDYLRARSA